ncbi:MAG TPA: HemK/PrmC family methyltransferase [Treponemataceae bacterium]|nr:HemK/PrmC family methyltransferase [Treponemataceae bacterium]
MTIKEARQNAYRQLSEAWEKQKKTAGPYAQKPDFFLDIDVILQELLQVERSFLLAHNETKLKQKDIKRFFALIQKRSRGLPIAYIVGKKEFYGLSFFVSPHVLIPKPDTEILVEKALELAREKSRETGNREVQAKSRETRSREVQAESRETGNREVQAESRETGNREVQAKSRETGNREVQAKSRETGNREVQAESRETGNREVQAESRCLRVLDLCTGSGCIALSFAQEFCKTKENSPPLELFMSDISLAALRLAKKNTKQLFPASRKKQKNSDKLQIKIVRSNLFRNIKGSFDFILTNPPYVPTRLTDELLLDGRSEPRLALDGGKDGLRLIRQIAKDAKNYLKKDGWILIEAGEYHAKEVALILRERGFSEVAILQDLSGQERVIFGQH